MERFGRVKISNEQASLCPYFEIESYLEYKGEQFSVKYDPNSLLYISKVRKSLSAMTNDIHCMHCGDVSTSTECVLQYQGYCMVFVMHFKG